MAKYNADVLVSPTMTKATTIKNEVQEEVQEQVEVQEEDSGRGESTLYISMSNLQS
jgi:hypothetical protein